MRVLPRFTHVSRLWAVWLVLLLAAVALSGSALAVGTRRVLDRGQGPVTPEAWWGSFQARNGDVIHLTYGGFPAVVEIRPWTPPTSQDTLAIWYVQASLDATVVMTGTVDVWIVGVHSTDCSPGGCPPSPWSLVVERVGGPTASIALGLQAFAVAASGGATVALAVATRRRSAQPSPGVVADA